MRFGGIVCVVALTLGACSSDPAPREPSPSASAAAATPTATPPTMPPQASEDSLEGAAAFVKHYVDVFNYAAATGDVAELSRLSAATCDGCQRYIDLYRDTYEAGGYFKGGDWRVGDMNLQSDPPDYYATVPVEVQPGTFRETKDESETSDAGERNTVSFALRKQSEAWKITQFGLGEVE